MPSRYRYRASGQSRAEFGVIFHAGLGGGYALLVQSDGRWHVYAYDKPGNFRSLASGSGALASAQAPVTLGVAINGSQFSLYANNTVLGNVVDSTYPKGDIGIVVTQGGVISASNFSLYSTTAATDKQGNDQQDKQG